MPTLCLAPRDLSAPWFRLTRHQAAARGVRLTEWLAIEEVHRDVRHSANPKSGGVVAGVLTTRRALGWVWAPTAAAAKREAPTGAAHVIAHANLLTDDRDGWLRRPLGEPVLIVTPYFAEGTVFWRTLMTRAQEEAQRLGVPFSVHRIACAA